MRPCPIADFYQKKDSRRISKAKENPRRNWRVCKQFATYSPCSRSLGSRKPSMPYSNAIPVTLGGLASVVSYLTDENHKDHVEYRLSSLELAGTKSVEEFIGMAKSTVASNRHPSGRMRPGRPPKNAAQWYIARVSDGTRLTPDERRAYMEALQQEASHGDKIVGLGNFHRNRLTVPRT